jgi:hypothetical protein
MALWRREEAREAALARTEGSGVERVWTESWEMRRIISRMTVGQQR